MNRFLRLARLIALVFAVAGALHAASIAPLGAQTRVPADSTLRRVPRPVPLPGLAPRTRPGGADSVVQAVLSSGSAALVTPPAVLTDVPTFWRTRAERTEYRQTSDHDETMRYVRQLEAGSRWVKFESLGRSGQGREIPMLIVSRDRLFTPEAARASGRPVVMVLNAIHSGEVDGKDASLAYLRDLVILRKHDAVLDSVVLLVVPVFSVDAHDRRSRYHRINQNGPEEMGWRHTPAGYNLNRDWLKAESPEMRALLGAYTRWWPELLVDNHTTNGADYRHDITYAFNKGPGQAPGLTRWFEQAFEGRVTRALTAVGRLPAPYVTFRDGHDPRSGIDFGDGSPRFSSGYPALHGRAGLLVETHMLKPYATRVRATYDLLSALLGEIAARPGDLRQAVREAEQTAITRGRAPGASFALATRTSDRGTPFEFKGVQTRWQRSDITGGLVPHWTAAPWDTVIQVYRDVVSAFSVPQPAGYIVPQEWTAAVDLLRLHGVRMRPLARAHRDSVEMSRITDWSLNGTAFEGRVGVNVRAVRTERQARSFRAGDLWVPLDQRSAPVALHLLEAQGPDGLLAWGFLHTVLQRKEYGEDYVVEPLARWMMARDPALASEFRARLAADSAFARDPDARTDWFYRRSPWADPEQDLLPFARALRRVPENVLVPEAAGTGPR